MLAIEEELGSKVGISHALYGLGEVASALGEYQSAREHYKKTLAISEELGRKDGIASALYRLEKQQILWASIRLHVSTIIAH